MAKNFAEIAFSDSVKEFQKKFGSRASYARMEKESFIDGLSYAEVNFILQRDSFYMASIGENKFPYIQHRGGPKGFLKVLDTKRIACIDFSGNKQYITLGNVATNNNVCLFLMDYANKARLKIFAKLEIVELSDNQELHDLLNLEDYKFKPERMMIFHIEAYDWNCPQHIVPRFTIEDIQTILLPQKERIAELEAEIIDLKNKLQDKLT